MNEVPELFGAHHDLRLLRYDIAWDEFERILAQCESDCPARFTYDRGTLEIARSTLHQEATTATLAHIVRIVSEALGIDVEESRSTTLRRRDLRLGLDPDASFFFRHAARVAGQRDIALPRDPSPDLVIDFHAPDALVDKTAMLAAFGVPEVWQYDEVTDRVAILRPRAGALREKRESAALVPLTGDMLTDLVREHRVAPPHVWSQALRSWLREYD